MQIDKAISSRAFDASAPVVTVLLHGYGADERDLATLGEALYLPWVSPRAPLSVPNGGAAWFPIETLDRLQPQQIEEATDALWEVLDEVLDPATKILAVGFSQGGLMATQLLRTRPERIAATVVLSGFVLGDEQPADTSLAVERPNVFYGRGDLDRVIPPTAIARTLDWLEGHANATVFTYPSLDHAISATEMQDLAEFLQAAGVSAEAK